MSPKVRPKIVNPAKILAAKLSEKALMPGAAFPRMAKVRVTIKLMAMRGAAIWRAMRKMFPVLWTKISPILRVVVRAPGGVSSKLLAKAANMA